MGLWGFVENILGISFLHRSYLDPQRRILVSILRPRPDPELEGAMAAVHSNASYSGLVSRCFGGADDILPAAFDKLVRPLHLDLGQLLG